eukprot:g10317.t1
MPLDINIFRREPDVVRESQRRRFEPVEIVDEVIDLDNQWRECRGRIDDLNKAKNLFQKEVTKAKKAGGEDPENAAKIKETVKEIKTVEVKMVELGTKVSKLLPKIGNIVADDVPVSNDEDKDNKVVSTFGPNPTGDQYMHHHEVLHRIGGYEPERGVGVAGHRAYFLRDAGLLLNQALINYGIAFLRKRKYSVLQPPFFMTKDVMAGVAQLEQFDEELYKVSGDGVEKYLIATSEQPMCAFHKGEWLKESELPLRYGGVSTCFRKEAGAHGKDTWGIFRVHQFEKVEQFCICEGDLEKSAAMQEEMSKTAEEFYQSLGLSYRVVNIVSGELNNAAIKKHDLEAWFPAYEEFRELVSCSNCTDYQARGMEVRSGQKKGGQTEKKYVHMLNSTLCATTRTMSCILENYQTPTGVTVPEVLVPYMGGITFLDYVKELPKGKREAKGATKGGYATSQKKPAAAAAAPAAAAAVPNGAVAAESTARGLPGVEETKGEGGSEADAIGDKIAAKGLEIRELKKSKPDKAVLKPHVDTLIALKAEYKEKTGKDYVPVAVAPASAPAAAQKSTAAAPVTESPAAAAIAGKIVAKGDEIRELKKSKADKATLQPHIDALIALKTQYKDETGKAYVAPGATANASGGGGAKKQPKKVAAPAGHNAGKKKGDAAASAGDDASRGLPPPPAAKGPVMENGKPHLENLAQHLLAFSYVAGWAPGEDDASMFELLSGRADAMALPAVARWLGHIGSFSEGERAAVLLRWGADPHVATDDGFSALHIAAQEGHLAVMANLIKAGARLEARIVGGATPLHLAAQEGRSEAVAALFEAGADVDSRQETGVTPLYLAAKKGHVASVRELLRAGANPLLATTVSGVKNTAPLEVAAVLGRLEVVRELIQQVGIGGCGGGTGGVRALEESARRPHVDVMAMLMNAGVVDTGEALLSAVACARQVATKFLLQRRELEGSPTSVVRYVNCRTQDGRTPLFCSIGVFLKEEGVQHLISPKVVRLLIDAGADPSSVVHVNITTGNKVRFIGTPLAFTISCLREKKVMGVDVTDEQMDRLEAVRRLLLRVEALHVVSWLWARDPFLIGNATGDASRSTRKPSARGTKLAWMLPMLRRRRRGVLLGPLFRYSSCP